MKTVFTALVLNPYRSTKPRGFYHPIKGHTGVDLNFKSENLPTPISGEVVGLLKQKEMGNVMYIEDAWGTIHVFAHLMEFKATIHQKVKRNEVVAITGNTGAKSTAAHLHYEVLTIKPTNMIDNIMTRALYSFKGYNTDPIPYLKKLYASFNVQIP